MTNYGADRTEGLPVEYARNSGDVPGGWRPRKAPQAKRPPRVRLVPWRARVAGVAAILLIYLAISEIGMRDAYKWLSVPVELLIAIGCAVFGVLTVRRQRSRNTKPPQ
jgi:hypothetical protein